MIVNVFVAFHERELSFSRCCSWLKGEPPGTRTLAAGSQKKTPFFQTKKFMSSRSDHPQAEKNPKFEKTGTILDYQAGI